MLDQTYIDFVRTIGTKDGRFIPPAIAALGLAGEAAELVEAVREYLSEDGTREEIRKELGDCLWYVVALAGADAEAHVEDHRGAWHPPFIGMHSTADAFQQLAGKVCDKVKKSEWHDKDVWIGADLLAALSVLEQIAGHLDTTLDHIAAKNVEKLQARWPQGFGR